MPQGTGKSQQKPMPCGLRLKQLASSSGGKETPPWQTSYSFGSGLRSPASTCHLAHLERSAIASGGRCAPAVADRVFLGSGPCKPRPFLPRFLCRARGFFFEKGLTTKSGHRIDRKRQNFPRPAHFLPKTKYAARNIRSSLA